LANEPLKDNLSGFWSRRIDDTNRLVYPVDDEKNYGYFLSLSLLKFAPLPLFENPTEKKD
jgi:hypothetical protein